MNIVKRMSGPVRGEEQSSANKRRLYLQDIIIHDAANFITIDPFSTGLFTARFITIGGSGPVTHASLP
jgi:hypothetical protein